MLGMSMKHFGAVAAVALIAYVIVAAVQRNVVAVPVLGTYLPR